MILIELSSIWFSFFFFAATFLRYFRSFFKYFLTSLPLKGKLKEIKFNLITSFEVFSFVSSLFLSAFVSCSWNVKIFLNSCLIFFSNLSKTKRSEAKRSWFSCSVQIRRLFSTVFDSSFTKADYWHESAPERDTQRIRKKAAYIPFEIGEFDHEQTNTILNVLNAFKNGLFN